MKRALGSFALPALLALAGLFAAPQPAAAHGGFRVVVRAPHAAVAFGFGHPAFRVGAFVAPPYAQRVFYARPYGYGFWAPAGYCSFHGVRHAHFVPVHRYRSRWIVAAPGYAHRGYRSRY